MNEAETRYWKSMARRMRRTVEREQTRVLEAARHRRERATLVWALVTTAVLFGVLAGRVLR